ncbi:MAG TPA: CBS domain-containing protein [Haliscomenobacter sp.]|uniref:CBS domain-containing protein n=1 Tax=Haliscomenobacter sp. TaxID=2717303 RepID=UPI001DA72AD5|nr:CBS domain-containing protein [Haliscomenobacter sp.]MBK9487977.1 CBS domain-containing protein [Haliscomenobacter sp.]HOY18881.1 CBS domain-containing protein [Haliscomenobacter sp.]
MNVLAPVKSIMSTHLITVAPSDKLSLVKDIFDDHNIHHIPVVRYKELIGIISKTDFMHFLQGFSPNEEDRFVNYARLRSYAAEEIMTKGLAKLNPDDRINVALEIFLVNRFHAIPVVENDELVGILTTYDIIKALATEPVSPKQILENRQHEGEVTEGIVG